MKIKEFFTSLKGYIWVIGGAVIGVLAYLLNRKNEELEANKAKIALIKTQKEADAIESEIKSKLADKALTEKEIQTVNDSLKLVEEKRTTLTKEGAFTDSQIEDYWNKK